MNPVSSLIDSLAPRGRALALGALERRVLESLWKREGPATVRAISADFPSAAYTTLMTTLDRLYHKGILDRERDGRAYAYRPRYTRADLEARMTAEALDAFLAREPAALRGALSFFVEAVGARDAKLLDELEELVRERRRRAEEGQR